MCDSIVLIYFPYASLSNLDPGQKFLVINMLTGDFGAVAGVEEQRTAWGY